MLADRPSLGTMIRSRRLGWGHVPAHGCFLRASDAGAPDRFRIELCPPDAIPARGTKGGTHYRAWWEGDGGDALLALLPWLRNVRRVKKYISVIVDESGAIVRAET